MTEQAGIRTLFLAKSQGHLRPGDVINLMSSGFEQQRIHNAWHVTGNTTAPLCVERMVRVRRYRGVTLKLRVASHAHSVRLVREFHGGCIRGGIVAVGIMAGTAAYLALPEALRTLECLDNERRLTKSAVFIETLAREISKRNPKIVAEEGTGGHVVQFARWTGSTNRRLHMALRANTHEITIP